MRRLVVEFLGFWSKGCHMESHQVMRLTAEHRAEFCAALRAIRVHEQAKILRNIIVIASLILLAARVAAPDLFAQYGETGLSVGSIRVMTIIASGLAFAHEWSSRARRGDAVARCAGVLETLEDECHPQVA